MLIAFSNGESLPLTTAVVAAISNPMDRGSDIRRVRSAAYLAAAVLANKLFAESLILCQLSVVSCWLPVNVQWHSKQHGFVFYN
jgi:hypothetical protein